jgi:aquaporin Z
LPNRGGSVGLGQKLSAEIVGTFFVTLTSASVDTLYYTGDQVDFVSRWLTRGFMTAVLIYSLSEISGAHLNPVVSLAFALRKAMRWPIAGLYCVGQFAGGFAAGILLRLVWHDQAVLGASHPGEHWSHLAAAGAEVVLTFFVVGVILATADPDAAVGKQAALAVGFAIAACGFFGGPISGASMNPARSLTTQLLCGSYGIMWIYVVGPVAGAIAAALAVFPLLGPPDMGERKAATGK